MESECVGSTVLKTVLMVALQSTLLACTVSCSRNEGGTAEKARSTASRETPGRAAPTTNIRQPRTDATQSMSITAVGLKPKSLAEEAGAFLRRYAEELAKGDHATFFATSPKYLGAIAVKQQGLPQSEWPRITEELQAEWRQSLAEMKDQLEDYSPFEFWANRTNCAATFSVTEVRPFAPVDVFGSSTPRQGIFTVFLRCAYADPTNAPIYGGRRLSEIVLNCVVQQKGTSFTVAACEPVSALVKNHPIPSLSQAEAEVLIKEHLLSESAPRINIPTQMAQRSYSSAEKVLAAFADFAKTSSEFGVSLTKTGHGGQLVLNFEYAIGLPDSWATYTRSRDQASGEFNLFRNLSVSVLSIAPGNVQHIGETKASEQNRAVVAYLSNWEKNEIFSWWSGPCLTFQKMMSDNDWNCDRANRHAAALWDGPKTNTTAFHWAVDVNAWKPGRQ